MFDRNTWNYLTDVIHITPSYGLNSITSVLQRCIWHWITHEGWYAIKKPRN